MEIILISGPKQICRHGRQEAGAVLAIVGPAHLDAGDFGKRVRPVGWLQRTSQKVFFFDRLRTQLRIDAAGAQEQQALGTPAVSTVDHVRLNGKVLKNELAGVGAVGQDAAYLGGGQKNILGALSSKELPYGG